MGKRNGPYNADFPEGTRVRVRDRAFLELFMAAWKLHDPLESSQRDFAGKVSSVRSLGYHHGGDELYWLSDIPGTWHEACLENAVDDNAG